MLTRIPNEQSDGSLPNKTRFCFTSPYPTESQVETYLELDIMVWAVGEKELKWYPDGEHVRANYLDEVIPYTVDWHRKHFP